MTEDELRARALELVQANRNARHDPLVVGVYLVAVFVALIEAFSLAQ